MTGGDTTDDGNLLRGRVGRIARLAASFTLLGYILYRVGPAELVADLRSIELGLLLLGFIVVCVDSFLRAYNWKRLLELRNVPAGMAEVFTAFAAGGFFGYLVPSSLGPDAARSIALARREGLSLEKAASSVVMLNLAGLWALGIVFLAGAGWLALARGSPAWLSGLSVVAGGSTVAISGLLFTDASLPRIRRGSALLRRPMEFLRALADYRSVRSGIPPVVAVAVLNQLLAMLVFYLAFRSTGVEIHPLYFVALVPAVTLARLVPASVAGFGAEQAVVVVLFSVAGVAAASALSASVAVSTLNLAFTAGCGLLYVSENVRALVREPRDTRGDSASAGPGTAADRPIVEQSEDPGS